MPESSVSTVVILLSVCVGLLVILILIAAAISRHLGRLERLLAVKSPVKIGSSATPPPLTAAETSPGGPFEAFLAAEPARKALSKKEQAAAYRKWRQENGMNWSNS
jgi:hypothetical protein